MEVKARVHEVIFGIKDIREFGVGAHAVTAALLAVGRIDGNGLADDFFGFVETILLPQQMRLPDQGTFFKLIPRK